MERASLKELYDNRDLIAQIFDIKNQMDKLPNTEELCKLKRQLCVFFDYLPNMVIEDKDAKIIAGYTFSQSPMCVADPLPSVDTLTDNTYLIKKQVQELIQKQINSLADDVAVIVLPKLKEMIKEELGKNYLNKITEDKQTVMSPVEFHGTISYNETTAWSALDNRAIPCKGSVKDFGDDTYVSKTGNDTITGLKTFTTPPRSTKDPEQDNELATKGYVDADEP